MVAGIIALCGLIYFIHKKGQEDKEFTVAEFKETLKSIADSHNQLMENQQTFDKVLADLRNTISALETKSAAMKPTASFGATNRPSFGISAPPPRPK